MKNETSETGYAGTFIKGRSTLNKEVGSDEEASQVVSFSTARVPMTDEELLMACGGRTAHK